jgi:hypothetical protein
MKKELVKFLLDEGTADIIIRPIQINLKKKLESMLLDKTAQVFEGYLDQPAHGTPNAQKQMDDARNATVVIPYPEDEPDDDEFNDEDDDLVAVEVDPDTAVNEDANDAEVNNLQKQLLDLKTREDAIKDQLDRIKQQQSAAAPKTKKKQ